MTASRIECGVLGATGMVGQQLVRRLDGHPWFRVTWLCASERSAGRAYGDVPWLLASPMPDAVRALRIDSPSSTRAPQLVFSALDAAAAVTLEPAYAAAGHVVVSNTRTHRLDADVPLVVPEVNADHLALIRRQREVRGWRGAIVTNPNCSTVFLAMVLAALRPFGVRRVIVTTLQALSGAGYPGVPAWDGLGNVIPFIDGEEEKIESETVKILGSLEDARIVPHNAAVSAQATRVAVLDGHTESIAIEFDRRPAIDAIATTLREFRGRPQHLGLPSAPAAPVLVLDEPNRPQPRLDVDRANGMAVCVGRVRPCPVLHVKLVALGHNTIRGAAGAAILNAELLAADGWLDEGGARWSS